MFSNMRILAFLGLFSLSVTAAQICPPLEALAPCVCFESNRTIACKDIRGRFNLKQIFDNAASFVGDDVIFDALTVHNTPTVEIEDRTFDSWKFINISITSNENLLYISPNAFHGSRNVTRKLNLGSNYVDQEGDLFEVARGFENLVHVLIGSKGFTSVPDNAFENLHSLENIYLAYNAITEIGSRTFSQLPKLKFVSLQGNSLTAIPEGAFENLTALEEVDLDSNLISQIGRNAFSQTETLRFIGLYSNRIPGEGLDPEAFQGIGTNVGVDMEYNGFTFMEQNSFKPLLDRGRRVLVGGGGCSRNGCSYRHLYCDERVNWICDNLELYEGKLAGYRCFEGLGLISDYCRSLNTVN